MYRLCLCLLLLAVPCAGNVPVFILYDLLAKSDVVVHGRVVELREDSAIIEVSRSWKRTLVETRIAVSPITVQLCTEVRPTFRAAEEVVVFLRADANGRYRILVGGHGKAPLEFVDRAEFFDALEKFVAVTNLDEDGRNRAMLGLVSAPNPTVRREAHLYIGNHIRRSKLRDAYRADLVALLKAEDPSVRRAALWGLRFVKAPEAIATMIELTRDPDVRVVQAAGQALAHYDIDATVAAVARLTMHADKNVRARATTNLSKSRHPLALDTLVTLLDQPDPETRRLACGRLVRWVWRLRRAKDGAAEQRLAARITGLIDEDPDESVRIEAVRLAGESRNPALVAPVVRALKVAEPGGSLEKRCLDSLRLLYNYGGDDGKRRVEAHMDLVVRSLRRGTGGGAPVELMQYTGRLDELRWAAERHPDEEVRKDAQRYYEHLSKR